MRILYLSSSFPLISETFILYEIADLLKAGMDIRILSFDEPPINMRSSLPEELGFADRIFYRPSLAFFQPFKLLRVIRLLLAGYSRHALRIFTSPKPSADMGRYELLETIASASFDDWQADIIHCHFGPNGNAAAALKKSGLIKAAVTTVFHGYDLTQVIKEKPAGFYNDLFEQGSYFFCINKNFLQTAVKLGAPETRLSLLHMGVDCEALAFNPRSKPQSGKINLITIGRLTEKKGHAYTVAAFARVLKEKPDLDLHLDIIGDGPLRHPLQDLVKKLGIANRVTFHGALQHGKTQEILTRSHIFLLPSVKAANGDEEGIPMVLMEAMASGLPVISTRHSGIPELIEDGVSGFLVDERDELALAGKLVYLLDQPGIWGAVAGAARSKIETDFNRKTQSKLLMDKFRELAGYN